MKVLYVYEGKMNGHGLDLVADYQLQALGRMGCQVDLVSRGRVEIPGVTCRKVVLNPAKLLSGMSSAIYYSANRRWLAKVGAGMLRRSKYDVVIGWQRSAHSLFAEARKQGIPCLLSCASARAFKEPRDARWPEWTDTEVAEEYEMAAKILAPSTRTREVYVSQGLPEDKVCSVERGYDPGIFYPPSEPAEPFRVLYCGRICERKGARQLLAGWDRAGLENAELWYLGAVDGELKEWAAEIEKSGRKDVRFLGFREDVGELMRLCSVHAMLSSKESMGKSFIEAAACGLVNLATADVGFPVVNEVNGLVVNRDSSEEVAGALKRLHGDKSLWNRLAQNARSEVEQGYTWEAFMERIAQAVKSVL